MKTIFVIFTKELNPNVNKFKKYTYNIIDEVKVGDMIASPNYETPMYVSDVLDESYNYVNLSTGELKDKVNHPLDRPIRTLKLIDSGDLICGTLIKQNNG